MAITIVEYTFLLILFDKKVLPNRPSILELGEQHWHGDIALSKLRTDIENLVKQPSLKEKLINELTSITLRDEKKRIFDTTKIAYKLLMNYSTISAIDLHGTEESLQFDLNLPVHLDQCFDITINFGTGEHIFNVYQFFKTVHDLTALDGLMLHCMPFTGWIEHGFFNFQPTFYWDLATANNYEVVAFMFQSTPLELIEFSDRNSVNKYTEKIAYGQVMIADSSNIYVAFKKKTANDFRIPQQGFFQISPEEYWNLAEDNLTNLVEELKLKEINLIAFPDWSQSEELLILDLEKAIKSLTKHPDRHKMTLLLDTGNFIYQEDATPELFLSTIVFDLLLKDHLDIVSDGPEVTLVEDLTAPEWQAIFSKINYRVVLDLENQARVDSLEKLTANIELWKL